MGTTNAPPHGDVPGRMVGRLRRRVSISVAVLGLCLAFVAFPGASALAATGQITRAEANGDWTLGSVAGSASWPGCEHVSSDPGGPPGHPAGSGGSCTLQPFVTVGTSACTAQERGWPHTSGELALAWEGATVERAGTETFDVSEVPLSGEPGQVACLTLLETYLEPPECTPGPGVACPAYINVVQNPVVLDEASLSQGGPERPVTESCAGTFVPGRVCGTLNPGSNGKAGYYFAYNTGSGCQGGHETAHAAEVEGEAIPVSAELSGLQPGTEYAVCLVATGPGTKTVGDALHFRTAGSPPPSGSPPSILSESVSQVSSGDAMLEAQIDPQGLYTAYQFQIDTDSTYDFPRPVCPLSLPDRVTCESFLTGEPLPAGLVEPRPGSIPAGSPTESVGVDLASIGATLQPGTAYHFRVIAANTSDGQTVYGPDQTFTTPAAPGPFPEQTSEGTGTVGGGAPTEAGGATANSSGNPHRHRRVVEKAHCARKGTEAARRYRSGRRGRSRTARCVR